MTRLLNNIEFFLITVIIALGCFGCTDEIRYNTNSPNLVVEGYISSDETSRTLYIDDGESVHVSWASNDYIGLIPAETGGHFQYSAKESSGTTEFSPVDDEIEDLEGQTIYAYYPYNDKTSDNNRIAIEPTFHQSNNQLNLYDVMIAKGIVKDNKLSLNFKHIFAFLKVTIKTSLFEPYAYEGNGIQKRLYIETKNNPLCYKGTSYYNFMTDSIESGEYSNNLKYTINDDISDNEFITCYIAILPTSGPDVISIMTDTQGAPAPLLMDKKTPETGFKAGYVYDISVDHDDTIEIINNERQALIDLYNATDGDNWKNNTNWCSDRPISEWYGLGFYAGYWGFNRTSVSWISLGNNNLCGEIPPSIVNLRNLQDIFLEGNYLTGNIPETITSLSRLEYLNLNFNCLAGTVPEKVTADPRWEDKFRDKCCIQREGYKLDFPVYRSSDYSEDKKVITLQHHTKGKGLKVYILGEMYTDRDIADGTYMDHAKKSMGYFFSKEPFTSFRDYFDVYCVNVVSSTDAIGMGTVFETGAESKRGTFLTRPDLVIEYLKGVQSVPSLLNDVTVMVLMKTNADFRANTYMYSDGLGVGFNNLDLGDKYGFDYFESTIHHEVCGHAFGKLADEYTEFEGYFEGSFEISHQKNENMNVDIVSDPQRVIWSYFITDPRYKNEKIGVYEGAFYFPKGAYRATESSIMKCDGDIFNAPSRRSIYQRIMELSGEGYSFEKFLEYDEINRQMIDNALLSRGLKDTERDIRTLTAPPVYYDYPSSEIGRH